MGNPKGSSQADLTPGAAVAILAGGRSARMNSDKAFLELRGRPFVSVIAQEALNVSSEVLVVIGRKDRREFERVVPSGAHVLNDAYDLGSPLGGMLTAFEALAGGYAVVLACDTPFVTGEVIKLMRDSALRHSAAVPRWESGRVEPLCSCYAVDEAREATRRALKSGGTSCRSMISLLSDVNYVPVSTMRSLDPSLASLANFNTPSDLRSLEFVSKGSGLSGEGPGLSAPLQSDEEVSACP